MVTLPRTLRLLSAGTIAAREHPPGVSAGRDERLGGCRTRRAPDRTCPLQIWSLLPAPSAVRAATSNGKQAGQPGLHLPPSGEETNAPLHTRSMPTSCWPGQNDSRVGFNQLAGFELSDGQRNHWGDLRCRRQN